MDDSRTVPPLTERAGAAFSRCFGYSPRWAAAAPGRVNLIGEHTDYNEGFVLPLAIDRRAVVVAAPAAESRSRLHAADLDETVEVDLRGPLAPRPERSWVDYVVGVAHHLVDHGANLPDLDLAIASNVPIGSGLSSSAAITVATATLLEQVGEFTLDPLEKALVCQRAERDFAGTPCGIMDMLVASSARPGHALLIDCRSHAIEPVPLPAPEVATLLVADTGVRRRLAHSAYEQRRATCVSAARRLGVAALRDATMQVLAASSLSGREHARAAHVIGENTRTRQAATALVRGDLAGLGALMFESHDSLRDLYEVSCPELDTLVTVVRRLRDANEGGGIFGARMTGAGFGGCVIALCRPDAVERLTLALEHEFAAAHGRTPTMFVPRAAGCAAAVEL